MGNIFTFPDGPAGTHLLNDVQLAFFQRISRIGTAAVEALGGTSPLVTAAREMKEDGKEGRFIGAAIRGQFGEHPGSVFVVVLPHDPVLGGVDDQGLLFRIIRELVGTISGRCGALLEDHSILSAVLLDCREVVVEGVAPNKDLLEFLNQVHKASLERNGQTKENTPDSKGVAEGSEDAS